MRKPLLDSRGYSLLEVLVASAVLASIMLAVLAVLGSGTEFVAAGEMQGRTEEDTRALLKSALDELAESRLTDMSPFGDSVSFMIPVDANGDGFNYNENIDITWGGDDNVEGSVITIGFEKAETLSETTLDADLNRDGDRYDVFDRGRLVRTDSVSGQQLVLGPDTVVLVSGAYDGDINSDGFADPIFTFQEPSPNEYEVRCNLWNLRTDRHKRPYLVRMQSSITLRNPQR